MVADRALDPAFGAQVLTLPSETDIAREIGRDVDPDAILAARDRLARRDRPRSGRAVARGLSTLHRRGPTAPTPRAPAAAPCATSASISCAGDGTPAAIALRGAAVPRRRQHDRPHGGAVDARCTPCRSAQAALADFYQRYAAIRWCSTNGWRCRPMVPDAGTLDRVRALTAHPAFSFSNPNRIRALVGTFAHGNQTQFNRPDGAGYDFVADTCSTLDAKNPQLAARLSPLSELALARNRRGAPARSGVAAHRGCAEPLARRERHRRALAQVSGPTP